MTLAVSLALPGLLAVGAGMFVAGGVVKGTLGVGLPLVVVPLLTLIVPAPQAMGLLVLPVLLSNVLQALEGGRLGYAVRRFAPLIVAQLLATLLAIHFSRELSLKALDGAIALTVLSAVVLMLLQPRGEITPRHEVWAGPLVGAVAGTMAGVSSLTGPILITYLMALRLKRDEFVGSISIIYLLGAVPMYAGMLAWGPLRLGRGRLVRPGPRAHGPGAAHGRGDPPPPERGGVPPDAAGLSHAAVCPVVGQIAFLVSSDASAPAHDD